MGTQNSDPNFRARPKFGPKPPGPNNPKLSVRELGDHARPKIGSELSGTTKVRIREGCSSPSFVSYSLLARALTTAGGGGARRACPPELLKGPGGQWRRVLSVPASGRSAAPVHKQIPQFCRICGIWLWWSLRVPLQEWCEVDLLIPHFMPGSPH